MGYVYIFTTILLTVYGQLILKWRLDQIHDIPKGLLDKAFFFTKSLLDPYIFSSFLSAFFASLTWMATLKEFELSKAYPFMNLSLVFVVLLSFFIFHENFSTYKIIGCILIIVGVLLVSKA
jgi:drug/metabolite transporter (DMT)-like permease